MAWSAHKSQDAIREHEESKDELARKVSELGKLIVKSKHMVVFTGAGISTSAGIPDFRGPQGVWTLRAQGKSAKAKTSTERAFPTPTHMALVELEKAGRLQFLISQNCDGIHRRSGFPVRKLAELHGNGNLEYCKKCRAEYLRDFGCHANLSSRNINDHRTGRFCVCGEPLHDSIIHFGENLPKKALSDGFQNAHKADLMLVLGSSLTVTPACDMPREAAERGAKLVIVNLQKTAMDDQAAIRIHGKTDEVMGLVMRELGLPVPAWHISRFLRVAFSPPALTVHGQDASTVPSLFIHRLMVEEVGREGREEVEGGDSTLTLHNIPALGRQSPAQLLLHVQFLGYFNEPPTTVQMTYDPRETKDHLYRLDFDTSIAQWSQARIQ